MAFFEGIKMTGGYGSGPDIISSCSVNVNQGEIVSILGPNGAGKSTAMKAMLGLLNLKSGKVVINGKDISHLNPQDRVRQGIAFVPQNRNVFAGLSVEENLEMGAFLRDESLQKIIEDLEINSAKLNIDMSKDEVRNIVDISSFMASGSGARGTPTFFINEELVIGYISIDRIEALLR